MLEDVDSDDFVLSARHIVDVWGYRHRGDTTPDLRLPIAIHHEYYCDAQPQEFRLTAEGAKELIRQLEQAIVDAETGR